MQTEIELRILDIDVQKFQSKLTSLGAVFLWESFMKRFVYDFTPIQANSWIRLRDTWKKTTLTIKEIQNDSITWTKELETIVEDFDTTHAILKRLGYTERSYQENRRLSYSLWDVAIEIDFRPHLLPYIEIEWKSIQDVEKTVTLIW